MNQYAALVHRTTVDNFKKIKKSGQLLSFQNAVKRGLVITDGMGASGNDPAYGGQFPGTYFKVVYIGDTIEPVEGQVTLIFPITIMEKQKNWHFNLIDRNGYMTYDSYFYFDACNIPSKDDLQKFYADNQFIKFDTNEIIVHSSLPLTLLHTIVRDKPFTCNKKVTCDESLLDKKTMPIPFSEFDEYSGIEYKFFNRQMLEHMKRKDYNNWVNSVFGSTNVNVLQKLQYYYENPEKRSELDYDSFKEFVMSLKNEEFECTFDKIRLNT